MTKRTVEFEYDIGDAVEIIALEKTGRVCSLWYGEKGLQYEVAYFFDGERHKEYLFASEIGPAAEPEKVGFVKCAS